MANANQDPVDMYRRNLRSMLSGIYRIMRDNKIIPAESRAYLGGYMMAARTLEILTKKEMDAIAEEANMEVFGMSVAERKKKVRCKRVSVLDEEFLAIPTVMRRELNIW